MRESYVRALLLTAGLAAVGLVVFSVTGKGVSALLAVAALVVALWRYCLPVVYELNDEGLDQWVFGRRRHIAWHAVRRYEICTAGVLLLPGRERSPLAPLSGLYLPWSTHREDVVSMVRGHLDRRPGPSAPVSTAKSTVLSAAVAAGQGDEIDGSPPQPLPLPLAEMPQPPREGPSDETDLSNPSNAR